MADNNACGCRHPECTDCYPREGTKTKPVIATSRSKFVKKLVEVGLIPGECTRFTLTLDVNKAIKATVDYLVTEEQLELLARVASETPDEVMNFAREHVFVTHRDHYVNDGESMSSEFKLFLTGIGLGVYVGAVLLSITVSIWGVWWK